MVIGRAGYGWALAREIALAKIVPAMPAHTERKRIIPASTRPWENTLASTWV